MFDSNVFPMIVRALHKICENTDFPWPIFSRVRIESYGQSIRVSVLFSHILRSVEYLSTLPILYK